MHEIIENRLSSSRVLRSENTALLAIHWQNDIVENNGAFGSIFATNVRQSGALKNTVNVIAGARQLGVTVIHVVASYDSSFNGHIANNALFRTVEQRHAFVRGSHGAACCAEITPCGDETVVEHTRINAFYGTDLSAQLCVRGITNLAITGVATNVAVDHTVREAVQAGFNTYLLEDCCCSSNPAYHDAAMLTLAALSTHVMTHEVFLSLLRTRIPVPKHEG